MNYIETALGKTVYYVLIVLNQLVYGALLLELNELSHQLELLKPNFVVYRYQLL